MEHTKSLNNELYMSEDLIEEGEMLVFDANTGEQRQPSLIVRLWCNDKYVGLSYELTLRLICLQDVGILLSDLLCFLLLRDDVDGGPRWQPRHSFL